MSYYISFCGLFGFHKWEYSVFEEFIDDIGLKFATPMVRKCHKCKIQYQKIAEKGYFRWYKVEYKYN